ncbi:universal stress protein [Trinickia fusca]
MSEWPRTMLKLLIPIVEPHGAALAAQYAAAMFLRHCACEVELLEVLEPIDVGRASAFHSRSQLQRREKRSMLSGLLATRAILERAGVPCTSRRVFGEPAPTIAAYASQMQSDIVVIDASHVGLWRRFAMLARLWQLTRKPVTMLR